MMDNLLAFFGLREDPFRLTPDPVFYFPSRGHQEALHLLEYIVRNREGFCMVTGEPGTGKTTLINVFREQWKDNADIALVLTPRLSPDDFLMALFEALHMQTERRNKNELLKQLKDLLIEKYFAGRYVVIIVDEAHNLPIETLEELRLLSNLETDKEKLVQIILIGQPELETRLLQEQLRQLDQRITERIRLHPLTVQEMIAYIKHRLNRAGYQKVRIGKHALRKVHHFSRGIPRLINLVLSRTIMAAYIDQDPNIQDRHIVYALRYLAGRRRKQTSRRFLKSGVAVVASVAVCLAIIGYRYFMTVSADSDPSKSPHKPISTTLITQPLSATPLATSNTTPMGTNTPKSLPTFPLTATVKYDTVNVRSAPSLESPRIGFLYKGMRISIHGSAYDGEGKIWYKVFETERGSGWVSNEMLALDQNATDNPT
ncbi:MAG: AAA family ATPase [Desulfobacterota bacterium]|nr:AAA family ATPase [Thermodesulfobacteriota bacterium]